MKSITTIPPYTLYYEPGKVVRPKIGKIFIFANYDYALDFCGDPDKIFECEAGGVERLDTMAVSDFMIPDYWAKKLSHQHICSTPRGTLGASWVKLL